MQKIVKDLIKDTEEKVTELIETNPYGHAEGINLIAKEIETNYRYRTKDFDEAIKYFIEEELNLYKSGLKEEEIRKGSLKLDTSKRVTEQVKEYRKERNRKTSKIDTNLLTHAPYVVGGSRARKEKAEREGSIKIEKSGIRKMTYENDKGKLLTMKDAQVLFGLFSLWEEQGYGKQVNFTEYQLNSKLGGAMGGKQYKHLRDSLDKIWNTSVVFKESYSHKRGMRYKTKRMRILSSDEYDVAVHTTGRVKSKEYRVRFSDEIRESISEGYYSLVSLTIFNELETDISKGLYLLITGISDMDNNEVYQKNEKEYEFNLLELYQSLLLEAENKQNKRTVERGCEELKKSNVIEEYTFEKEGRRYSKLIIELTDWGKEILRKKEEEANKTKQLTFDESTLQ